MINQALYRREMRGSLRLLLVFAAVLTMYVSIIISMYDPAMMAVLDNFAKMMPKLMASVGMTAGESSLMGFMISYLYGFILLIFPMLFCILRGNSLIAGYVERGSMTILLAAPVKRKSVAVTQMAVLISGVVLLLTYTTVLEAAAAWSGFPGELKLSGLLKLNAGLLCLHLFIGSICFLSSCIFSDTKYSLGFGAGIPSVMYLLQMLASAGGRAKPARYFSLFTLYDPRGIAAGDARSMAGLAALLIAAAALYTLGTVIFCRKDLHI